jgi:hypothetical protein
VFAVPSPETLAASAGASNKGASIKSYVPGFLMPRVQYLDSQWSFLQIRGLGKCIAGFNNECNKIIVSILITLLVFDFII